MTKHLSALLEREVSRKEFLGISGLAIASIFGFGTVIKLLTGKSLGGTRPQPMASGYGSSAYGGIQK